MKPQRTPTSNPILPIEKPEVPVSATQVFTEVQNDPDWPYPKINANYLTKYLGKLNRQLGHELPLGFRANLTLGKRLIQKYGPVNCKTALVKIGHECKLQTGFSFKFVEKKMIEWGIEELKEKQPKKSRLY